MTTDNVLLWPRGGHQKRILHHGPTGAHLRDLVQLAGQVPGCGASGRDGLSLAGLEVSFVPATDPAGVVERLHGAYFNAAIVDLRRLPGEPDMLEARAAQALRVLDALDEEEADERYAFHRIIVLLSGADDPRVDRLIAAFGARGVGHVLRDPGRADRSAFARLVVDELASMLAGHRPKKTALCLAGGGITAIYFELGALKCLDDCVQGGLANRFDMYFGISAGAVVAGILAQGYSIDEAMAGIAGYTGGRVPPLSLSLLHLGHVNFADIAARAGRAVRDAAAGLWRCARGRDRLSLEALFPRYSDWVGAPLRGDRFEGMLRDLFTAPGGSNDFRRLPQRLYVGATDQDARTAVLFGDDGREDVPVSRAIQASLSMNPAFSATEIGGRWYTDGGVTRTSNFSEAIRKNADLICLVDAFVPYVSKKPGFSRARGLLYNIDQDVRAMSYTRFELARAAILRRHPEVSSYIFLPGNSTRGVLSANPMDHRPFLPIWRGAYLSTLRRIDRLAHRLAGDLGARGLVLDTRRAQAVASRLAVTSNPSFADFFPERKIELRQPPLACAREATEPRTAVTAA